MTKSGARNKFFDRDLSWLSFNERVLKEAARDNVPLMERIRFMAIYSSNLDEFYRVRVPAIKALKILSLPDDEAKLKRSLSAVNQIVMEQLTLFGRIMDTQILPALHANGINLIYKAAIPRSIHKALEEYFIQSVASYVHITRLSGDNSFFPENNKLYIVVTVRAEDNAVFIVNIPSDVLPRFYTIKDDQNHFIVFLDDIIKLNLSKIFRGQRILSCHSIKVTRDSDLNLEDEFTGNLARKIEKRILVRDSGLATRFLYEPGIPKHVLKFLQEKFQLDTTSLIPGGQYHNLKDLGTLPLHDPQFQYGEWPQVKKEIRGSGLFGEIRRHDILLHPPYHTYDTVLRFFNEASIDAAVKTIYVTLYRIAKDSRIAHALMNAARNGKNVIVFVELKARFDEANNIKWSRKMKAAGVRIIESIPGLKVHAKIALVKRKVAHRTELLGLLATGNFNEVTARFYTDHILMTSYKPLLSEVEALFKFLKKRKKKSGKESLKFKHLLVGHFNLQEAFLDLIDHEITNASQGLPAEIVIKFNNLEDQVLISKLYDASRAGVKVSLIIRGISCLIPGVQGMSENIAVTRIVDRYLEHGRIFMFANNGTPKIYLGSADWMNRNIYRRIEVCFPLRDEKLIAEMIAILKLQLADNCQAVLLNDQSQNLELSDGHDNKIRSQLEIAKALSKSKAALTPDVATAPG